MPPVVPIRDGVTEQEVRMKFQLLAFELNQAGVPPHVIAGAMLSVGVALTIQVGDPKQAVEVLAVAEGWVTAARQIVDEGLR